MNSSISGKCHCGSVEWKAELPPKIVLNCHCNMCRELSGADYSSWVVLPAVHFNLVKGADYLNSYKATDKFSKSFCSNCGSTVSCINNEKFPDHIYVARGNIIDEVDLKVDIQVYTTNKAAWIDLNDNIPAFNP